ncbi:MAG TPA: Gfo/Idh/MocA family oxidoreductase [Kiritimatiellia bacterium]|nr:Gfo/Idh/MocA family oxidoreductase [Kiritimatiellia bacterium]HPA78080.1 Gfo/Idh/MocA family oxidoreductase [Kiritimatiellia bacterium]HQQ04323.1 Gfo/Idh/MocA family oxidoreductase [Kiritimatiellia bacterium]
MKVAIIGAGLQCRRRAPVINDFPETELAVIASDHAGPAQKLAAQFGCEASDDWRRVVERDDIDIVAVCTPPHVHAEISIAAMKAGKHVLCEKPLTRTVEEAEQMLAAAKDTGRTLKCGFNHRHHPAVWEAHQRVSRGEIGRPLFARCRYGICGRPGYENEWRADPAKAAGGQFIEQGTHAIDLFRWFLGEITEAVCMSGILYFKKQSMDDSGMALFRTDSGATASLHTTLTEWQNQFSFEVFGEDGYLKVEGLGSSYGNERLIAGRRDFDAPFQDTVTHYRGGDISWREEWREFLAAIREKREPIGNGQDGLMAMRIALTAYEAELQKRVLPVKGSF